MAVFGTKQPLVPVPGMSALGSEPSLVVQSLADTGCFPSDARAIYESLGASDKHLELVPGAHYLEAPDGAREAVADLIAGWLSDQGA